jgi:hypothetical protein
MKWNCTRSYLKRLLVIHKSVKAEEEYVEKASIIMREGALTELLEFVR